MSIMQWSMDFKTYSEQLPNSTCRRTLQMAARSDLKSNCTNKSVRINWIQRIECVIQFIKAGRKPKKTVKTKLIIMSPSTDEELRVDVITRIWGGARGAMVIVAGIGHGDTSSNPGLIAFHIALIPLGKVWIQLFSLQLWVNSRAD